MQFVDKQNDLPGRVFDFLQHGLQPVLKFAAIFSSGEHGSQIKRNHALIFEDLGHVARDDAARKSFDDGGLPYSGFPDQHRIVFGSSR